MREQDYPRKVTVVYQMIVATWVTPWALELLLLVYRYVSCCLSVALSLLGTLVYACHQNRQEAKRMPRSLFFFLRRPLCAGEAFSPQGRGGQGAVHLYGAERRGAPVRHSVLHPTYLRWLRSAK